MVNIAIVDDNKAFLQEMKQNIEACKEFTADMVCDTYCSGADFLQADRGAYQLAILDMQMAGMGGYETAQKLREKNENAVIAFVSGAFPGAALPLPAKKCGHRRENAGYRGASAGNETAQPQGDGGSGQRRGGAACPCRKYSLH